jgi:hypothetical protein
MRNRIIMRGPVIASSVLLTTSLPKALMRHHAFSAIGLLLGVAAISCFGQTDNTVVVQAGTPMQTKLTRRVPMKIGQPITVALVYPIYVGDRLALPAGCFAHGRIVSLNADRQRRNDARLNADFTPYYKPVVRLNEIELPNGNVIPISTYDASDGGPLLHLSPPAHAKRSRIRQQWQVAKQRVGDATHTLTAPGKADRLKRLLYSQLPYHPEQLDAGISWSFALAGPVKLASSKPVEESKSRAAAVGVPSNLLHAYLDQALSSKDEKAGNAFRATVAEPVRDVQHNVLIPEGAIVLGTIVRARPARSFGRSGVLRFDFRQLQLPGEPQQQVSGTVVGADSRSGVKLQLDAEGEVKPEQQSKILVPLAMVLLASRPLDDDFNQAGGATVGSNGLGLIGRLVGIASTSRNVAAGIGFYGTAISVYRRWIRRGREIEFPQFTRIDIELSRRGGREISPETEYR